MKKTTCSLTLIVLLLISNTLTADTLKKPVPNLEQSNIVRVALPSAMPPFSLSGELTAILPQLISFTFKEMGLKAQFTFLPNRRLVKEFRNHAFDAAFAVPKPYNAFPIYYSNKVIDFQNIVVTLKSQRLTINHIEDLANKRIAAFQNATEFLGYEFNQTIADNPFYTEFNEQRDQITLLMKNRTDAIILEKRTFKHFYKQLNTTGALLDTFTVHPILAKSPRYMAFHSTKMRKQFNDALATIKTTQQYHEIMSIADHLE